VTRTVAAFDFDGTLTRRDSLLPFVASVVGWTRVARAFVPAAPQMRTDRDRAKEKFLAGAIGGMSHDALRAAGASFAHHVVVTPEMQSRLAWHRREGHEVVIVSASLDLYLCDVGQRIGADHVLCSSLEVDEHKRVTGRLIGGNCRGPEKAKRLLEYIGDADAIAWAYGDTAGDRELLALAAHPVRVKRGRPAT
jgi:phosphatidylglycerophosphatase C